MVLFIGYLIQKGKKSTTLRSYISAIHFTLLEDKYELKEDKFLLASLTRACKFKNDYFSCKLPIQKLVFSLILRQVCVHYTNIGQPYLCSLDRAILSVTYYRLLRVGEVTCGTHPILAKDVHVGLNKRKFLFILRTSKTHLKDNRPQMIKICSTQKKISTDLCHFAILREYNALRPSCKSINEPFFVFCDNSIVTPSQINKVLKDILLAAGLDPKAYSMHGMRAGHASDLLKLRLSVETIHKLGRWKSNAVFNYLRE